MGAGQQNEELTELFADEIQSKAVAVIWVQKAAHTEEIAGDDHPGLDGMG